MKTFISITDEDGVLLDRFRVIDSTASAPGQGWEAIYAVEPGEEDAETEGCGAPMAHVALVSRIRRAIRAADGDRGGTAEGGK